MKKRLLPLVVFILSLFIGLIINLPIAHLFPYIELDKSLKLAGISGTLVEGKILQVDMAGVVLLDLNYEMQPGCLLLLSLCYQLKFQDSLINVQFQPLTKGLKIEDSILHADLSDLTALWSQMLVKPTGQAELQLKSLEVIDQQIQQIEATAYWRNVGISEENLVFGDFRMMLTKFEQRYVLKLTDTDGDISVDGSGYIKEEGQYKINVDIKTKPGISTKIQNTLDLLARKSSSSSYQVNQSGQIPDRLSGYLAY